MMIKYLFTGYFQDLINSSRFGKNKPKQVFSIPSSLGILTRIKREGKDFYKK